MTDKLNKEQIIKLLPHREPMLLIDELINIVKLSKATAIMNVKKDSFSFKVISGQPVMPGTLIVEAFGQAAVLRQLTVFLKKHTITNLFF